MKKLWILGVLGLSMAAQAHQAGVEQGTVSVFTGVAPHAEQIFAFDFFGGNELVGFGNVQTRYISRLRHGGRSQGQGERGGAK